MLRTSELPGYQDLAMYVGDIHNHCGISYGHGSIEDAYANAKLQLDFASVTGHAAWHDMPRGVPEMAAGVAYHEEGFARLAGCWDHVQDVTERAQVDGEFVSLLSFEWHSSSYGDHCVYYEGGRGDIIPAPDLESLRAELRKRRDAGQPMMALPHHIGYRRGYRGANWSTFTPEFAPVVEMMSMHGCGEVDDGPRPYLHTMGPRCSESSAVHGLSLGHRFGMIGSTDHHSAHPGSHGHGRVAAWASELTRGGIWEAFESRRVYALTGDPIRVAFSVNGAPMGSATGPAERRRIRATVDGVGPLDYLEVVRNGLPVHRVSRSDLTRQAGSGSFTGTVGIAVGWGHLGRDTEWDVRLRVQGGRLAEVTPRLKGEDIVMPTADAPQLYQFSSWGRSGDVEVWLRTMTHGNPNVVTDATQGLVLHLAGDDGTRITGTINGIRIDHAIGDLRSGSVTGYLQPWASPAYRIDRAVPAAELTAEVDITDTASTLGDDPRRPDWYYLRVRQTNDQWAWSSPVWVENR